MAHLIIGTAGHIDHGKTALVKALTNIDTDTLPEERSRGVTIDIGFAYWKKNVTIIDVPGHERFIKNMVTGVCAVDLALFVVAADDGVMPQTQEHLSILKLLGVRRGIVVLTKVDLVETEWIDLVKEDLEELFKDSFLEVAPIISVSSLTGEGIETLKELLENWIVHMEKRPDRGVFRLPVDRAFSMRGFGTVVTGTVLSGQVRARDEVVLLPVGKLIRVRGIQIHGQDVEVARVGDRAAVNLTSIEVEELERGDILGQPGFFNSTYMIDARLHLLADAPVPLKNRSRVHLHLGPREVLARVVLLEKEELLPGGTQLVQFRLETSGVATRGDRYVIRRYSPVQTIGGGIVLDPQPRKHRRFREEVIQILKDLEQEDPTQVLGIHLKTTGFHPRPVQRLASDMGISTVQVEEHLKYLMGKRCVVTFQHAGKDYYAHGDFWDMLLERIQDALTVFHRTYPLRTGIKREELRLKVLGFPPSSFYEEGVEYLIRIKNLKIERSLLSLANYSITLSEDQSHIREEIQACLLRSNATPPSLKDLSLNVGRDLQAVEEVVVAMQGMGDLVRLEETLLFHPKTLKDLERKLVQFLNLNEEVDVATFRDMVGTTRKYAVPLLNFFDNQGVTVRQGNVRVLKM